jgi:adenylate kinase family enzyme
MKRILIVGSGGAGKSTLARRLGKILKIEVIHLDTLYWQPNWVKIEKPKWYEILSELTEKDSWIMDGNYDSSLGVRIKNCDTIIFLDFPRLLCLYRVLKRRLTYRKTNRPDMAAGCNEKIDFEFIEWIWNYPKKDKLKVEEVLKKIEDEKTVIRLKSQTEVEKFLLFSTEMKL